MSDRVAIVAGAGGPLGQNVALRLAAAGFTVVGVDRNAAGLRELPDGIVQVPGDTTDPAVAKAVVERVVAEVGAPRHPSAEPSFPPTAPNRCPDIGGMRRLYRGVT